MSEEQLKNLVNEYADLAKDKKIDVASLMINALERQDANRLSSKTKRWSYLISLGIPPVGYLLALWFYFRDETNAKEAAIMCAVLTTISLVLTIVLFQVVLKGSGTSVQQIEQIKPTDIYQLSQ